MLVQILFNSILSALLLSLVAIGFSLVFNATKVFHLAHGGIYITSIYSFFEFNGLLGNYMPAGYAAVLAILLTFIVVMLLGIGIELLVYRPLYLKKVNPSISLISSLGVYLLIVNVITLFLGNEAISLHNKYRIVYSNNWFKITDVELVQLIAGIVLLICISVWKRGQAYTRIRAITYNYAVAEKFGINIQRTRIMAIFIASLLAAIAAILKGYEVAIEPNAGMPVILTASVAVIIGGIYSFNGTILACFAISVIQNFSVKFLSAQWKDTLTYSLLILVIVFYQQGLVATKQRIETK